MKKILFTAILLATTGAFSQVGIGTTDPKGALDIVSSTGGLIIPRVADHTTLTVAAAQTGMQVYNTTTKSVWLWDGTVWVENADGTDKSKWTNDATNTRVQITNLSNGTTARTAGTEFVVKDDGNVGIGTTTPDTNAALDITSTNKGVLLPRVALTSATDIVTIAAPTTSLMVYNTATAGTAPNNINPGYYYWNGTKWQGIITPTTGLVTKRVALAGTKIQTITDPDTPATDAILVTYEDSNGDAINATVKTRTTATSFDVEFASAPPATAFLSYAFAANPSVVATGPQGPAGLTGPTGATGATGPAGANAIFRGQVACDGTILQSIADTNVTSGASITVTYEDPAGDLIYATVKTRTAGTGFDVQFAAIPPITASINYTIVP